MPVVRAAPVHVAVLFPGGVVVEQRVPDLVRDGESDPGGTALRVELDPRLAVLGHQPRVVEVLARDNLDPERVSELERVVRRSVSARPHSPESEFSGSMLDPHKRVVRRPIDEQTHHRRVRPCDRQIIPPILAPRPGPSVCQPQIPGEAAASGLLGLWSTRSAEAERLGWKPGKTVALGVGGRCWTFGGCGPSPRSFQTVLPLREGR